MNGDLLFDPMFRVPFLTGLCLAAVLSLVGALLRMRDEWLSALGLSQVAAAGGLAGLLAGAPALVGAFCAAGLVMLARSVLPRTDNNHHGLLILAGWSGVLLLGSFMDHGQVAAETLLRGQLYFTSAPHLVGAAILLLAVVSLFPWLSPRLLTDRFFPDHHAANRHTVWPYRAAFAALVALAVVLGTLSVGAFPAFALLFVPSWVCFVCVDGWRQSVTASVLFGCLLYGLAFVLAILSDLPFGPVVTSLLVLSAALRFTTVPRRRRRRETDQEARRVEPGNQG